MARKQISDPYLAALEQIGGLGRSGLAGSRFPNPGRIRTSIKMRLRFGERDAYYPVIYQSDLAAPSEKPPKLVTFRQRQWIGGMGQRVMSDPDKYMVGACHTMRMNEFQPQPYAVAVTKGSIGGKTCGEYLGVPKKIVEFTGSAPVGTTPTSRRLYLATYDVTSGVHTTRIYMLKSEGKTAPNMGWYLLKTITGWEFSDMVVIDGQLRVLGSANGKGPIDPESNYYFMAENHEQDADWLRGGPCREHNEKTPDGEYYSYQRTFYYPNGSVAVGSSDYGNSINNIVLFNGTVVLIKPDGLYTYTKAGNLVSLKVNLRAYFDPDTGRQACQWGQLLYFNLGKLICAFDGEQMAIMPPIWSFSDPDWLPTATGMCNCGEGLAVSFNGRCAVFDGADWHPLYRLGDYSAIGYSSCYKEPNDHGYPLVVACTYTEGAVEGTTRIWEYYPSFFRPLSPETRAEQPSYLISSAFETDNETFMLVRNLEVKARNLSSTFGIRAWGRPYFYPDSTTGFIPMNSMLTGTYTVFGSAGETWYTFTVPTTLATLTGFQYKLEFVPLAAVPYGTLIPGITDVRMNMHQRDSTKLRWMSMQLLCMEDYEFPDGSSSSYGAAELAKILWEAAYWHAPVTVSFWQPATQGQAECWVDYNVILRPVQHIAYVDESDVTGYIFQVNLEEA